MNKKDLEKTERKLDYKGCRNCRNQPKPMRMCEWAERGGDGHIHFFCPRWEHK